ncbi:MAG: CDP-diacylglycerol--serine O-phosphatidyltransferase [Deltaproteobacteria bacterium]|nr:CDP-diacylglycerol--serine O-phosphatidyltransferase [Deltaproteobacteria bacterium]
MHRRILVVPSLITVAAFFSGFLAIISAFRGEFEYATKCIAFAFIFDGLDGRVARRLNATTAFGKEFDSLSDVVAFGVAPAIMIYCWAFIEPANDFGVLVAFLFTVCGGARLARFNITSGDSKSPHFQGLPIPAAAAALTSAVYFSPTRVSDPMVAGVVALFAIALAFLMVSSIPFLSVKYMRFTQKNMKMLLFALALFVALAWYHSRMFFLAGSLIYVLSGPFLYFREERKKKELLATSNGVSVESPRSEPTPTSAATERH